jgi:hypothetical protein
MHHKGHGFHKAKATLHELPQLFFQFFQAIFLTPAEPRPAAIKEAQSGTESE